MNLHSLNADTSRVCELIRGQLSKTGRSIIAIAGPPASGKSTLAQAVVDQLLRDSDSPVPQASLLPMDGYHLDNTILKSRGMLDRKGAPDTFDAEGFCEAIDRLSTTERTLYFPKFDREQDLTIANSIVIHPETPVVVVEGNYLLLGTPPWSTLRNIFTSTVFLSPPLETLQNRLIQRWLNHGLDPEAARRRATGNDLPNAELVLHGSGKADLFLHQND